MLTCGIEGGIRVLRVCRPRNRPMQPKLYRVLLLHFEASNLCVDGKKSKKIGRTNRNCKKRFELMAVPLREGISDIEAVTKGRKLVELSFDAYKGEATVRTSGSREPNPTPNRVHKPRRTAGPVGVTA